MPGTDTQVIIHNVVLLNAVLEEEAVTQVIVAHVARNLQWQM